MTRKLVKPKPYQMRLKLNLKRKPGGQPGNLNAFKHGFYSHRFNSLELKDLGTVLTDNLDDEIALLRVVMRRVFEFADKGEQTLNDWSMTLSTLGAASTRLAGLLRTQQIMTGGKSGDVVDLLSEAIGVISHELGIDKSRRS